MAPRPKRKSTAKGVKRLPSSAFVYPRTRKYPVNTKARARAALSYGARSDTAGSYSTIRRKVLKRYPSLKKH